MFTGIIESTGLIKDKGTNTLTIQSKDLLDDLKIGSSIAVDGCCLTVIEKQTDGFTADVMPITFERTLLGERQKDDEVNLERAMEYGKRFEGHMVSGHVEGTAKLQKMQIHDNAYHLTFQIEVDLHKYIVMAGSIAINGISLTIIDAQEDWFSVGIIPHTWENTNLRHLNTGDLVNIETDLLAKYGEKLMQQQ